MGTHHPGLEPDTSHELRALLEDWLRTRHLARPLRSVDARSQVSAELSRLLAEGFSIVGVVEQGRVIGSLRVADALNAGENWRDTVRPLQDEQIIDGDDSLLELVSRLAERHWLFVRERAELTGFLSRSDLQRPPFRMLLFGLVSLFEMRLLHLVQQHYSEADIRAALNAARLEKARSLHAERTLRHEQLHLADCLQIADKRDLLLAVPGCAASLGFDSNNKASRFFGRVECLRDRLVHANDLVAGSSWDEILETTRGLADFLSRAGEGE